MLNDTINNGEYTQMPHYHPLWVPPTGESQILSIIGLENVIWFKNVRDN